MQKMHQGFPAFVVGGVFSPDDTDIHRRDDFAHVAAQDSSTLKLPDCERLPVTGSENRCWVAAGGANVFPWSCARPYRAVRSQTWQYRTG